MCGLAGTTAARGERGTGVWKKLGWGGPAPLGVAIRGWRKEERQLFNMLINVKPAVKVLQLHN